MVDSRKIFLTFVFLLITYMDERYWADVNKNGPAPQDNKVSNNDASNYHV